MKRKILLKVRMTVSNGYPKEVRQLDFSGENLFKILP